MSLKIEDILNDLESADTPEQEFANGLSTEKTASATPTTTENPEDGEAIVKEADAQGRIMAHAFIDELKKQAVAPVAEYPADPGAIPQNPAAEPPRGEGNQEDAEQNAKVNGIISQLTAANKMGTGEIASPAGVMSIEEKTMPNNPEIAYDQAKLQEQAATGGAPAPVAGAEKEAATRIISSLYDKYFG